MKKILSQFAKRAAKPIPSRITYRLAAEAIMRERFADLDHLPGFAKREELWEHVRGLEPEVPVLYLEFGVFEGYSISNWSRSVQSLESRFYGFDTFSGLPEDWNNVPKGTFDVGSQLPNIQDSRVRFVKGLFQDTWTDAERIVRSEAAGRRLVVHFDADLYSSTLFVLCKLDLLQTPYSAIFDEFYGDEPRALADYASSHLPKVRLIGSANSKIAVAAHIDPRVRGA